MQPMNRLDYRTASAWGHIRRVEGVGNCVHAVRSVVEREGSWNTPTTTKPHERSSLDMTLEIAWCPFSSVTCSN